MIMIGTALAGVWALIGPGVLPIPAVWSPDGQWIAHTEIVTGPNGGFTSHWIWDTAVAAPPANALGQPAPGPLAMQLWTTHVETGEAVLLAECRGAISAPGWHPRGVALAFGRLTLTPAPTPSQNPQNPKNPQNPQNGVGEPTRALWEIVVQDSLTNQRVLLKEELPLPLPEAVWRTVPGMPVRYSPDGRFLVAPQGRTPGLVVMRTDTGRIVKTLNDAYLPAWSPDGSKLAFFRWEPQNPEPRLAWTESGFIAIHELINVGYATQPPQWSSDNQSIYVCRRTPPPGDNTGVRLELLEAPVDGGAAKTLHNLLDRAIDDEHPLEHFALAVAEDGRSFHYVNAVGGSDHQIVHVLMPQREIRDRYHPIDHTLPIQSLALSPDGSRLAVRMGAPGSAIPPLAYSLADRDLPKLRRSRLFCPDEHARWRMLTALLHSARKILLDLPTPDYPNPASRADQAARTRALRFRQGLNDERARIGFPLNGNPPDPDVAAAIAEAARADVAMHEPEVNPVIRPALLPVAGEMDPNAIPLTRMRALGEFGAPLAEALALDDPLTTPMQMYVKSLSGDYAGAEALLTQWEPQLTTPDQRLRGHALRAQLALGAGDWLRAGAIADAIVKLPNPPRRWEALPDDRIVLTQDQPSFQAWARIVLAYVRESQTNPVAANANANTHFPDIGFGGGEFIMPFIPPPNENNLRRQRRDARPLDIAIPPAPIE